MLPHEKRDFRDTFDLGSNPNAEKGIFFGVYVNGGYGDNILDMLSFYR